MGMTAGSSSGDVSSSGGGGASGVAGSGGGKGPEDIEKSRMIARAHYNELKNFLQSQGQNGKRTSFDPIQVGGLTGG